SNTFVKDIHEVLSVGDEVTVKVLSVSDDGKIGLSIKKAVDKPQKQNNQRRNNNHEQHNNRDKVKKNHNTSFKPKHEEKKKDFDSLLAGFLKESEDRLTSLKRNTEGKRGGRGGRRS
ncbi:S1 RNA-binding domain-containing protein, partial [Ligilactobacillus salivarius]